MEVLLLVSSITNIDTLQTQQQKIMSDANLLPEGCWDTHLHVLDPVRFPFKSSRAYTPEAATLEQLLRYSPAKNFLFVQASVEDGLQGILHHLDRARREYPDRVFRAEIEVGPNDNLDDKALQELSARGVRALRLHGVVGIVSEDTTALVKSQFERLAKIAQKTGWCISAMCPLQTWIELGPWLLSDTTMRHVKIIIEHNACLDPKRKLEGYSEFQDIVELLDQGQGRVYIKLCGINRLDEAERPDGKMPAIPPMVISIAEQFPYSILWGSDWPHVKYRLGHARGEGVPIPGKKVDIEHELRMIKSAVSEECWRKMLVENPRRSLA